MKLREALQASLAAMVKAGGDMAPSRYFADLAPAIELARAALAEPVTDEPVAWALFTNKPKSPRIRTLSAEPPSAEYRQIAQIEGEAWTPLYTRPAAQEPVTDEPVTRREIVNGVEIIHGAGGAGKTCPAPAPAESGEYPPLPEPRLYAHELIANNGGVWLGCETKGVCERAYEEGETGEEVRQYYTADQMRAYARKYAEQCVTAATTECSAHWQKKLDDDRAQRQEYPPLEPVAIARAFHEAYERLAPHFGYSTRQETRQFDPTSPNGKLMQAVCYEVVRAYVDADRAQRVPLINAAVAAERERCASICDGIGADYAGEARRLRDHHATHAAGQRNGANECAAAIRGVGGGAHGIGVKP